jgi:hypothetical protein
VLTWNVGDLDAATSLSCDVVVRAVTPGRIVNAADAASLDANGEPVTATAEFQAVRPAPLLDGPIRWVPVSALLVIGWLALRRRAMPPAAGRTRFRIDG